MDFFQWILNTCYYTIHICVTHLRRSIMDLDLRLKMCLLQIKASTRYCMFFKLLTKFKNSLKIKISVISCGTCKWSIKIWLWKVRHILRNKSKYSQTCISPDINKKNSTAAVHFEENLKIAVHVKLFGQL